MTCYFYIRVSTDLQNCANQRYELDNFATLHHIKADEYIEETISSRKPLSQRKLGKLLKKLQKGDVVITTEISRLGRNMLEVMGILQTCLEKECEIITVKENYHLGGEINIYNLSNFETNVNSLNESNNRVELYNSVFLGASCHFDTTTPYFNIDSFSVLPLISSGNVLTDLSTLGLRQDYLTNKYTFNSETGLIANANNTVYYAYTFADNAGSYNNWNNYVNKGQYDGYSKVDYKNSNDDLAVRFYEARLNEDGTVTMQVNNSGGDSFIYFRGAFFRFKDGKVDIFKFKGPNPGSGNLDFSESYTVSVIYDDVSIGTSDYPLYYYGYKAWVVNI